jgi:CBS domain-containing protein
MATATLAAHVDEATAEDIMCRNVVTISPNATLREAVAELSFNRVSGLPVLDDENRCLGIISASDILSFEDDYALGIDGRNQVVGSYFDHDTHQWETVRMACDVEVLSEIAVSEEMSRDLVSVLPTEPIPMVARRMLAQNVHRVLVIDEFQKLRGMISTTDFVKFCLR